MASYTASVDDLIILFQYIQPPMGYGVTLTDVSAVDDAFAFGYGHVFTENLGLGEPVFKYDYQPGAVITELINIHHTTQLGLIYSQTLLQRIEWLDTLLKGQAVGLTDGLGLHLAQVLARAVAVTQKLGLHDVQIANSVSQLSIIDRLLLHPGLFAFFGLGKIDDLRLHDAFVAQFQFEKTLVEDLSLSSVLSSGSLVLCVIDDDLGLDDTTLVNMIFEGESLGDGIQLCVGWIDPGGGFTTWAMNTRTNAVTEYTNFQFNSFAKIGNEYYGANDDGLWLLNAETDAGANIVADIKSGLLEFGDSRYTQFDGVYVGIRTRDNAREWILKIQTPGTQALPEGATYIYQFVANEYRTTRISTGKGIRTRYFSWELVTPGPDFTLDGLEFVPLVSKRRV